MSDDQRNLSALPLPWHVDAWMNDDGTWTAEAWADNHGFGRSDDREVSWSTAIACAIHRADLAAAREKS